MATPLVWRVTTLYATGWVLSLLIHLLHMEHNIALYENHSNISFGGSGEATPEIVQMLVDARWG